MPRKCTTLSLNGLNYAKCDRAELERFIEERTGKPIPETLRGMNKAQLVHDLLNLDEEDGVFRFQDLPAELRNDIYSRALVVGEDRCNPNILRVSKQVYAEAYDILYDTIEVTMALFVSNPPYSNHVFTSTRVSFLERNTITDWWSPLQGGHSLLSALRTWDGVRLAQYKHIKVKIELRGDGTVDQEVAQMMAGTNHLLYSMCSVLLASDSIKSFDVGLTAPDHSGSQEQSRLQDALWPVNVIPSTVRVIWTGSDASLEPDPL